MENTTSTPSPFKPNIIFITVDQMRYPMHFPPGMGINNASDFVQLFMPRLYEEIWSKGVRFSNYYTAASDCTAGRATIQTGLYAYQTYSMLTLTTYKAKGDPGPPQPQLETAYPTIGKLLKNMRLYKTPYFGKWHLSYDAHDLTGYGYDSHTPPQDYPGFAAQGYDVDNKIAQDAATWLSNHWGQQEPYFFSVNFVNPHDKQWFWGGMQGVNFSEVCNKVPPGGTSNPQEFSGNNPPENTPPPTYQAGYRVPNWQPQNQLSKKPATQTLLKEVFQYQMGGLYEEDNAGPQNYSPVTAPLHFHYATSPLHANWYKPIAPENYWRMALDSYIQCMTMVDDAIGTFMDGLPPLVKKNSIFIFTADHGEYGSSHGLQGKGGTVYEEGIRVPLVVYDPNGRFSVLPEIERKQLCSSVDLLRMIVTIGYDGSSEWLTGEYAQMYDNNYRCDLVKILKDPSARGREYALHTTDEYVSDAYNQSGTPLHVIGLIQTDAYGAHKQKLGVYTKWAPYATDPNQANILYPAPATAPSLSNVEFYNENDLMNPAGEPTEINSTPDSAGASAALQKLYGPAISPSLIAAELQATLPTAYRDAQRNAYFNLNKYMEEVNEMAQHESSTDGEPVLARVGAF